MDHDIRVEKANAISRYRRIQRITTLFRFLELFVFLIIVSRFSTHFVFSLNFSTEYSTGIFKTLASPKFVFLIGNAIVISLLVISGRFSDTNGEKATDFYDEYVERCRRKIEQTPIRSEEKKPTEAYENCRKIEQTRSKSEEKKAPEAYKHSSDEKRMKRSRSEYFERRPAVRVEERRRDLRRSMTEKLRKSVECGSKAAAAEGRGGSSYVEDEMSSEEFRRTVEAFIARQQRVLREEEEEETSAALVSF